jgi:DNA-directed RNA polymerase subunit RPC12/RpoP
MRHGGERGIESGESMPISVICTGCGNRLTVRDEHIGKRIKCPQCQERFVACADLAEAQDDGGEDSAQKTADWLTAQWPAVGGAILMLLGFLIVFGTGLTRLGLLVIGFGVCSLGYWGLSSSNKDYNF